MKNICLFLTFLLFVSAYSAEPYEGAAEIRAAMECPYLYHSVNVTTGEYTEAEVDAEDGALLKRCYSSLDEEGQGWYFSFPNLMEAAIESPPKNQGELAYTYDASNRLIAVSTEEKTIRIEYPSELQCRVLFPNGDEVFYRFEKNEGGRQAATLLLREVKRSDGFHVIYQYRDHPFLRKKIISRRETAGGRYMEIEYYGWQSRKDIAAGKVKCIREPAGTDEEAVRTQCFRYSQGMTEVLDALGNKIAYHFKKSRCLSAIEQYEGESLYRTQRFYWQEERLISKTVEDRFGNILSCRSHWYDPKGNVIQHKIYGDLSGTCDAPILMGTDGRPKSNGVEQYGVKMAYDPQQRVICQIEDNGVKTLYWYDGDSDRIRYKRVEAAKGIQVRYLYQYDEAGRLIREVVDDGADYSEEGMDQVQERHIREIAYSEGKPETVWEKCWEDGQERLLKKHCYDYSPKGNLLSQQQFSAEGECLNAATYEYDAFGRKISETDEKGGLAQYSYDVSGNVVEVLTEAGMVSRQFDFQDRLIREGGKEFRYDFCGNRISERDDQGNETRFAYDAFGRVIFMTQPAVFDENKRAYEPETRYKHNELDQIVAIRNPCGFKTFTRYNVRGKPVEVQHPDGSIERFTYALDGSLQKVIAKDGAQVRYQRDGLGRILQEEHFDSEGVSRFCVSFGYNAFHPLWRKDPAGSTTYRYDAAGRLVEEERNGRRVEIGYDATGDLAWKKSWYAEDFDAYSELIVARGSKKELQSITILDGAGSVLQEKQKQEEAPSFKAEELLNELGQTVICRITPHIEGYVAYQFLDALGRVESVEQRGPMNDLLSRQEFRYDGQGNLARREDLLVEDGKCQPGYTRIWKYDAAGRVIVEVENLRSSTQSITRHAYDIAGRIVETVKPDGVRLQYRYDAFGRLEKVFSSDHTIAYETLYNEEGKIAQIVDLRNGSITYKGEKQEILGNGLTVQMEKDLLGRATWVALPDGSKIHYSYDALHLREVARESAAGEILYRYSEEYDTEGGKRAAEMIHGLGTIEYEEDAIRTPYWSETRERNSRGDVSLIEGKDLFGEYRHAYDYDGLRQLCDGSQYDSNYRRKSPEEASCEYDANGNCIALDGAVLEYDAFDRLIAVKTEGCVYRYQYDSEHRRLSKERETAEGTQRIFYLYQGDREIGSVDESGEIIELRVLGEGLGAEIGAAVAVERQGQAYAPIHDAGGNLRCLISSEGETVYCARFTPFGEVEEMLGESSWGFSSKRKDPETGLVYFGKRYYLPKNGKWITRDPLGCADGPDPYAYVRNNPLNQNDLYGLFSVGKKWNETIAWLRNHFSLEDYLYDDCQRIAEAALGEGFLLTAGFYPDFPSEGVYGKGEVDDKVRITMINGILNSRAHYKHSLHDLSETHGGCNIHFTFYPSGGWTRDMLKCFSSKLGFVSPEARCLAKTWKALIQEMGGVDGGGVILHYAHSIGGTDTLLARKLMTPEELAMIQVVTFGSASIIDDVGFQSVTNYVSVRDGVPLLDPIGYIRGLRGDNTHLEFNGSFWGIPFVDHMLISQTYIEIMQILGSQFIERYLL